MLRQNEQVKDEEEVYFNFINSIKSEVTKVRNRYERNGITDINLMKYHSPSKRSRIEAVRKIVGGLCCRCDKFNTHLLKYKISGATVVERYCVNSCQI